MAECSGVSEYCQECGICSASLPSSGDMVDRIVDEVLRTIKGSSQTVNTGITHSQYPTIPLGVSNHHLHLTKETFEILFGKDTPFEVYRDLYQPGEFASKHTVILIGPKMRPIENVRILGPLRKYDQVEISLTDAIQLGVKPPVRDSGDLKGSAPITVVGPKGSIHLSEGAVRAGRHVHMTNADASAFGIKAGDFIKVRIGGEKSTTFENVLVRINDAWKCQLHLDTDDANAAGVSCKVEAHFVGKM